MKISHLTVLTLALAGNIALSLPSRAQVGFGTGLSAQGRTSADITLAGPARYGNVSLYPLAIFTQGGAFANLSSGTNSNAGGLMCANFGFRRPTRLDALELGGWYWSHGKADLYEFHAREMFNPDLGLQVGYINSSQINATNYTLFAVYRLDSRRIGAKTRRPFAFEFGIGTLMDTTLSKTTNDFSFYGQATVDLGKRFSLNASSWYLRDRNVDLTRYIVGVGYNF